MTAGVSRSRSLPFSARAGVAKTSAITAMQRPRTHSNELWTCIGTATDRGFNVRMPRIATLLRIATAPERRRSQALVNKKAAPFRTPPCNNSVGSRLLKRNAAGDRAFGRLLALYAHFGAGLDEPLVGGNKGGHRHA